MKKIYLVLVLLMMLGLLPGCATSGTGVSPQAPKSGNPANSATQAPGTGPVQLNEPPHIDLTRLSNTMAYAQLYDMVMAPERHQGITLRVHGSYYGFQSQETGKITHLITVRDNVGCCEMGMEFQITGDLIWPDQFPQNNSMIELTGIISSISYGENKYPLLVANGWKPLNDTP